MNDEHALPERWTLQEIMRPWQQGTPFLSCALKDYLDVGYFVALKQNVSVTPDLTSSLGQIVEVGESRTMNTEENVRWVKLNWWIVADNSFSPDTPLAHISLPTKAIQTNYAQWVPGNLIFDVAFIFHLEDLLVGKYPLCSAQPMLLGLGPSHTLGRLDALWLLLQSDKWVRQGVCQKGDV